MGKPLIAFVTLLLFFALSATAEAQFSCAIQASDCAADETELFRLSALDNAHAELPAGTGGYQERVCCTGDYLNNQCVGQEGIDFDYVLFLSAVTNAHVEWADTRAVAQPPYQNNPACLSIDTIGVEVQCEYIDTGTCFDAFGPEYFCVASVSGETNAHVSDCATNPYGPRVCCTARGDGDPPQLAYTDPTPPNGATITENVVDINVTTDEDIDPSTCSLEASDGTDTQFPPLTDGGPRNCYFFVDDWQSPLPDGRYEFAVSAEDVNGNRGTGETLEITVFAAPPETAITVPHDGDVLSFATWGGSIQGTASDVQGIQHVRLTIMRDDGQYWDGSGWGAQTSIFAVVVGGPVEYTWSYAFPAEEGELTVTATAIDFLGFEDPDPPSITFAIDGSPPSSFFTNDMDGGTVGVDLYPYAGHADDDPTAWGYSSGVLRVEYQVERQDGTGWIVTTPWTDAGVTYTPPGVPLENVDFFFDAQLSSGMNRISARPIDAAGNVGPVIEDLIRYDFTFPFVAIDAPTTPNSPYNGLAWLNDNPIRGLARDDVEVTFVEILIQRTDGYYWSAAQADWVEPETWNPATDTSSGQTWATWELPYTPGLTDTYEIRVRATDESAQQTTIQQTVLYDIDLPQPDLVSPPDAGYVSGESITVTWDGTDTGSGIELFDVQARIGSGPWTTILTTPNPGTTEYAPVTHDLSYTFRIGATDYAGNHDFSEERTVIVDNELPECIIEPLNEYEHSPLDIQWGITDSGSGADEAILWVQEGFGGVWHNGIDAPLNCLVDLPGGHCPDLIHDVHYTFRCQAIDLAGNVGPNTTTQTTIDNVLPEIAIDAPDNYDDSGNNWANNNPFRLDWTASDEDSGLSAFSIEYQQNGGSSTFLLDGLGSQDLSGGLRSLSFGAGTYQNEPVIAEGDEFRITVHAWDAARNGETDTLPVIVDTVAPSITDLRVVDTGGGTIDPENPPPIIAIQSTAEDFVPPNGRYSDIAMHTIWALSTGEGVVLTSYECGTDGVCETGEIDVQDVDDIVYWVEVIDHAGNSFVSESFFALVRYKLARFVHHQVAVPIGGSTILEVRILNIQQETLSVTLDLLDSSYEAAGFISGTGDFSEMIITDEGRHVDIADFEAGGEGLLQIELFATEPNEEGQLLRLQARGENEDTGLTITDSDEALIRSVYPSAFSGLTDWAVLLLVALAVLAFRFRKSHL